MSKFGTRFIISRFRRFLPLLSTSYSVHALLEMVLQDKIDDALIGVKSTALKFGDRTPKILWEFSTAMVFGLGLSGYMAGLSWPFFLGLAGVGGHLTYQCFSVKIDDPSDCWEKFKSNHYLGFFIFISIVCGNLFRSEDTVRRRNEFRETILKNFSY